MCNNRSMKLIKQTENLAETLAETLTTALQNHQRVIWLVPGGSNIPISIAVSKLLDEQLTEHLVIMQTDERYVAPDSPDCNWHQLREGGFEVKKSTVFPILLPDGQSLELTATAYAETVHREFATADCIIGQFGIGPDGHTAGIKPHSPAATSGQMVAGYQAEDFTRVTLTFPAITQLTHAAVFAFGDAKRPVLEQLVSDTSSPFEAFPAGVFRQVDSTIYNDQIEN